MWSSLLFQNVLQFVVAVGGAIDQQVGFGNNVQKVADVNYHRPRRHHFPGRHCRNNVAFDNVLLADFEVVDCRGNPKS